jgi:hypothetical protein
VAPSFEERSERQSSTAKVRAYDPGRGRGIWIAAVVILICAAGAFTLWWVSYHRDSPDKEPTILPPKATPADGSVVEPDLKVVIIGAPDAASRTKTVNTATKRSKRKRRGRRRQRLQRTRSRAKK